ncbi:unnamed protein product [[Candida] boidinii]|nr:unnamed protein product [[Candida] boidinii]
MVKSLGNNRNPYDARIIRRLSLNRARFNYLQTFRSESEFTYARRINRRGKNQEKRIAREKQEKLDRIENERQERIRKEEEKKREANIVRYQYIKIAQEEGIKQENIAKKLLDDGVLSQWSDFEFEKFDEKYKDSGIFSKNEEGKEIDKRIRKNQIEEYYIRDEMILKNPNLKPKPKKLKFIPYKRRNGVQLSEALNVRFFFSNQFANEGKDALMAPCQLHLDD